MASKKKGPEIGSLIQIDPSTVLIDPANTRYHLHPHRISAMAESIATDVTSGGPGVRQPVEVQELTDEQKAAHLGKLYLLQTGAYRTSGLLKAIKDKKLSLALPAFLRPQRTPKELTEDRLRENNERENMSLMDISKAIRDMVDQGFTKMDIRKAFSTPAGKTGTKLEPRSNGWVNVVASFMDFPDKLKDMIHTGIIGYDAAYKFRNRPADKWDAMLDVILKDREAAQKAEETAELKFLEAEKKAQERAQKLEADAKKLTDAQALVTSFKAITEEKKALLKAAQDAAAVAYKDKTAAKSKDEKEAAAATLTKAEKEVKVAELNVGNAAKELAKHEKALVALLPKSDEAEADADEAPTPTPTSGKGKKPAKKKAAAKPITTTDVNKAAKATGADDKPVAVPVKNLKEALDILKSIRLLSRPKEPKTRMVGEAIEAALAGKINDAQLQLAISRLVGEYVEGGKA